jgi:hypothetical protein
MTPDEEAKMLLSGRVCINCKHFSYSSGDTGYNTLDEKVVASAGCHACLSGICVEQGDMLNKSYRFYDKIDYVKYYLKAETTTCEYWKNK